MTETPAGIAGAGLSLTTRLVNRTLTVVEACSCGDQSQRVCVLRGFDGRSRTRARQVRTRLRRHGVTAFDAAVSVVVLNPDQARNEHRCAYVEVNEGAGDSSRIAAGTHTPLVTAAPSETDPSSAESTTPVLRATLSAGTNQPALRPFPSAAGHVPDVAFDTFLIAPNQPETGGLSVRLGELSPRDLQPGTTLRLRCMPDSILVDAVDPHRETVTWLTDGIEVRQHSGIHQIHRDGLLVSDLEETLAVQHDRHGLRRQHA